MTCLHELIEAQAQRTPDAIAVACGDDQLAYATLNSRANLLARRLVDLDVGPDCRVGVFLTHSVEMVVALLAVLKAGGAYIPLDPGFPPDRVQQALDDAVVTAVVTRAALEARLPRTPARVLHLEDESPISDADNLGSRTSTDNLAYVMYTSGSTGRPKGVLIPHRSMVEGYVAWEEAYRLRTHARVHCQMGSFAFGVFHLDFVRALCSGGKLVLCEPSVVMDPPQLYEVMTRHQVDFAEFVPAALRGLVRYCRANGRSLAFLNTLIVGSDRWYMAEHRALGTLSGPNTRIVHSFGLTETGDTAYFEGSELDLPDGQLVPIGRPFPNIHAYVLDDGLRRVPDGERGELFIGGTGLARGISNRPDLTAEKFVPDPFAEPPGARMYRTGDQARVLADGNIEFLGRLDQMVKIRGFRVEPGEVEVVLKAHPAVADCVVMPREDLSGATGLVAYVATSDGSAATVTELREHVRAHLPDYMLPASFIRLDRMPLTPSGKVDRLALPAPGRGRPDLAQPIVHPRDAREALVASVFAEVLGIDEIGAEDSFFELGGHSLLAAMAAARLSEAFKVDVGVRDVFDSPVVSRLAGRLATLATAPALRTPSPIVPRGRSGEPGRLPLSFAQQRLWFLDQLQPQSSLYNELDVQLFSGRLDRHALERSLGELCRRHEILRTTFQVVDGRPVQAIGPASDITLDLVDLSREVDRERAAFEQCLRAGQQSFDLAYGPLFRAELLKFGATEHWLLICMHHIITDEWSMDVLKRELQALYQSFAAGEPSPLPELPVQYADYAVWQRRRLQGERLQRELAYWTGQLEGAPEVLPLPTDRPRPPIQSHRGTTQSRLLPPGLPAALRELGRREGTSLFMTTLAAFSALLHRYTGANDIVVGSPVANRTRPELQGLLGFFLNTLVLRTKVTGAETVRDLLRQVREMTLSAYDHQELPLEKLVEELRPERALSHNPLFQVLFTHQTTADAVPAPSWLPFSWMAKFDLAFFVRDAGSQVGLTCEYSTDLFDAVTVDRLLDHMIVLLEAIVKDPQRQMADLPLLTAAERRRLLIEWNETEADYPRDSCIHELFEAQVRRTPQAVAIRDSEVALSYHELNQRANQLAHHLRELGVGPDVAVGLCLPRSADLIVAVLAVLKAGGAYVPLDAGYPRERLAFMLADARVPVLITQRTLNIPPPLGEGRVGATVYLDRDTALITARPDTTPRAGVRALNLAYIIYTSGSTGAPKGIAMPHRPLVNLIAWQMGRSDLRTPRTTLQYTPISFDVSFQEIFSTLCGGAALVLVDEERRRDPHLLVDHIAGNGVERLFVPVAVLHQLAELPAIDQQRLRSVREIITAGEQLQITESVRTLFERLPETTLHNHYGPAETHAVTTEPVLGPAREWPSAPPIGRPIANARTYLLDARLEPVPIGVVGDLYLGGDAVSRGYLGRPRLTADRFIPDPFGDSSGARLYRTGDRARVLNDGTLEFLGRLDNQVKVRGFRIELGEIEAVLGQHPGVRESAVAVHENLPPPLGEGRVGAASDRRLAAYVALDPTSKPAITELRQFLQERLPDYMVPNVFVELDRLPLTPSGKLDRRALPAPDRRRPELRGGFERPTTPVEREVVDVWSDVLNVEQIGVNDNFFELGGHSLLATLIVSRLRSRLRIDLGVRDLFEAPTPKGLALRVARLSSAPAPWDEPALRPHRPTGLVPASFGQERIWFLDSLRPELGLFNVFDVHPIAGRVDAAALAQSLIELVQRHQPLRTSFELVEGRPMQVIGEDTRVPFDVVDLSQQADPVAAAFSYSQREGQRPFDLARGPLFRPLVIRLSPDQHQVLLTLHHIITDGWSMELLRRELQAVYEAFATGGPSPLKELPVQYADYVLWQRERVQGRRLEQELGYWVRQLRAAPHAVQLPADRRRPRVSSYQGASQSRLVSGRLAEALRALGSAHGASLFMTMLTALYILLHRWSGDRDLVIGTAVANRSRPELEGLIGLFANLLVLRTEVTGTESFRQLLDRVRDVTLGAYAHGELPFEQVVEALRPEWARRFNSLFNVAFSHNVSEPAPSAIPVPAGPAPAVDTDSMVVPGPSRYDFLVVTADAAEGFRVIFDYSRDLFDDSTMTRLLDDLIVVLEGVADHPDRAVDALPLLTALRAGA